MIDLFAGCGGLGLGLEQAGFTPVFVNELNQDARETYLVNRERRHPLLRRYSSSDIHEVVGREGFVDDLLSGIRRDHSIVAEDAIDLVVGGPPCQGFSSAGLRRSYPVPKKHLPSNHLYVRMVELIAKVRPRAFLFENVHGLLWSRWTPDGEAGEVFHDVLSAFQRIPDYVVKFKVIRSFWYGVPQNRPRILIVGFRSDVYEGTSNSIDAIEGGFLPAPGEAFPDLIDVLGDLVDPEFEYGGATLHYPSPVQSEFQRRMRTGPDGRLLRMGDDLHDHSYSNHSELVRKKFSYMLRSNGAIHHAHRTKKFNQRVLPSHWNGTTPKLTVTSLPDDFVHYEQARSLTVREWARMQTFPDWYHFVGTRTTGGLRRAGNPLNDQFERVVPKYTQIGNAVPVDLASAVGRHLASILRKAL